MSKQAVCITLLSLVILIGTFLSMTGCYCTYEGGTGCQYYPDSHASPAPAHK